MSGEELTASSWLHRRCLLYPHQGTLPLSGSLIDAANRGFRAREESWDEQTLHWCQSGPSKHALLTRQRLHDPLRTDNSKDKAFLLGLGVAWVAPCLGDVTLVSSYGPVLCQQYHDATACR
jgi:hypothetical protein